MDLNLKDKVYIVTGGSKGIGEAISRAIAAEGGIVVIATRSEGAVTTDLVAHLKAESSDAYAIFGDFANTG